MPLPERSCATCGAWEFVKIDGEHTSGLCRRRAPIRDDEGDAVWPWTFDIDWCWEHVLPPVQQTIEVRTPAAGAGGGGSP